MLLEFELVIFTPEMLIFSRNVIISFLGADTSARAAELLSLFGISDDVSSRLIRVSMLNKNANQAIGISNTTGSATYVQFRSLAPDMTYSSAASSKTIADNLGVSDGYILVSKGSTVAGSSTILFLVLGTVTV